MSQRELAETVRISVEKPMKNVSTKSKGYAGSLERSIGVAFFLRAVGAGLAFLLNVAIGRLLGASGTGIYFLSLSVVSFSAVFARLGLETTVLRFVAKYANANNWGQVRGVLRYALAWGGSVSLAFTTIILICADWFENTVFDTEGMAPILIAVSFSVVGFNIMIVISEALKGLGHIRSAMLVGGVLYPITALILVYPAVSFLGPAGAGLAYTMGTLTASIVGLFLWEKALSGKPKAQPVYRNEIRDSSRPLWAMTIVHRAIIPWTPLILIGFWGTSSDAGIYGAASRVALLVSFFLVAVNAVLGPRISVLYSQGEVANIRRLACRFSAITTIAVTPIFIVFVSLSSTIMGLFGDEFSEAGLVLSILVCGQAVNAMTGSVEYILMMSGREKEMRNIVFASMAIMLALAVLLIPPFGVVGAAISGASAAATTSLLSTLAVRSHFGFWVAPIFVGTSKSASSEDP